MAGILNTFVYKDDNATQYLVQIDNSNASVPGSGFTPATQAQVDTLPALPKTLKMRYVNCQYNNVKRRIYVGSLTGTLWTHATTTVPLTVYTAGTGSIETFKVTSRTGEKQRYNYVD